MSSFVRGGPTKTDAGRDKTMPTEDVILRATKIIEAAGRFAPYGALALIFVWFGGMKFTSYEAEAIAGLITSSPFVSWTLSVFGSHVVSAVIGTIELLIAACLAARFVAPKFAVIGAGAAVATFLVTFSFFFTTNGVFIADMPGPAISVLPGQFLLKDLGLLALSIALLHDSCRAARFGHHKDKTDGS